MKASEAAGVIALEPEDVVPDRDFTDLRHTAADVQTMRFMAACVCLALEHALPPVPQPLVVHQPGIENWIYRIVITQPKKLINHKQITVVGFFGIRNPDADVALAQQLDRGLVTELGKFEDMMAYVSICLPTGNFGNLVLFTCPEAKDQWGRWKKHAEAVQALTPDYYSAVRLYNGSLPDGIASGERMTLDLVKYYDYQSRPIWRAVRRLQTGSQS